MSLTRRNALALGSASFVVTLMPLNAFAAKDETMAVINAFTNGAAVSDGGINLTTPEIAENGNTVINAALSPDNRLIALLKDEGGKAKPIAVFAAAN